MKETIYTIPVNEAFDKKCGCPFCKMYLKLEKNRIEYTVGPSMMEPDARALSNSMGFCMKHFDMLLRVENKLSLALILDTHLDAVRKKLDMNKESMENFKKKPLFAKSKASNGERIAANIESIEKSCVICSQINDTMERYFEVFFDLFKTDNAFSDKIEECECFCIPHYRQLVLKAEKYLGSKDCEKFFKMLFEKQRRAFELLNEDVHKFTLKFDYRNKDMPWGNSKTAPKRSVYALGGQMYAEEEEADD